MADMSDSLESLARGIGPLLLARGWTLATAESCTGGLMGHAITDVSGSSGYFLGGVISYANEVKERVLGVPSELLTMYGAVSSQVAIAMAQGARRLLGADVAISATGVAGPTGGTADKPVGTVYVAVASPLGDLYEHHIWALDRRGNKRLSAEAGLLLAVHLLKSPAPSPV